MINPNLRYLKHSNGTYSMKRGLCESCGISKSCPISSLDTHACTDYQPVIPFKSLAGTEGLFNTFRLGGAWNFRVTPGQRIGLLDGKCNKIGEAVVESVVCGDKSEMLDQHAHMNHLILAKTVDDPVAELSRLVRNMYGTNFLARAKLFTVIYLQRVIEGV